MAIESGFYDSYNGDRVYSSKDFSKAFKGMLDNGVFPNVGNAFGIIASATQTYPRRITVKTGKAWIDGYWSENMANWSYPLSSTTGNNYRADTIYLEVNDGPTERISSIKILQGTSHSTPEECTPRLAASSGYSHVLNLGWVLVKPNDALVTNNDIHSFVGTDICPFCNYLANDSSYAEAMEDILDRLNIINDKVFFKDGDSVEIEWRGSGFVTNGGKNIVFSVPLPKIIPPNVRVTLDGPSTPDNPGGWTTYQIKCVQNGNYIAGSANNYVNITSEWSPASARESGFLVFYVHNATGAMAWPDAVNNETCGVVVRFTCYAHNIV